MVSPNLDLADPNFWNALLVNAITFLLPISLAIVTFLINRWQRDRQALARYNELIVMVEHELNMNREWIGAVRKDLEHYSKWVDSAIQDKEHSLPESSLSLVSTKPHCAVWESIQVEFTSIDRSRSKITGAIVLSYSLFTEAAKQIDIINQMVVSAVLARAARGQAVKVSSARLAYEMIHGLIDPLNTKLAEADEQGERALSMLKKVHQVQ